MKMLGKRGKDSNGTLANVQLAHLPVVPGGRACGLYVATLLLLSACANPIEVERISPNAAQRELSRNVISAGEISEPTQIVLDLSDLSDRFKTDPTAALADLHRAATQGAGSPAMLFALAELSFRHAEDTGQQSYYLAAAVYAYAFLFPHDVAQRPSGFDPRFRTACDIYNRALTSSFATAQRARVDLKSGSFDLPFGSIDITFDPANARWGSIGLWDFTPVNEMQISGLRDRYHRFGIGAPLAADALEPRDEAGFQVSSMLKVPVTALLRIDVGNQDLAAGHLHGNLAIYPAFEPSFVDIGGQQVPLEADTSAAFAYSLSDPKIWASELSGFLNGGYYDQGQAQLTGLEPYRPGQFPVVFIHGTASSAGRWADMINDLQSDPAIREHFQFWSFTYSTGNPTPFSAMQLRTALDDAVRTLDPDNQDPELHKMVLIGHSQGGLLAKMMVIDTGTKLWSAVSSRKLEDLHISEKSRALLRKAVFLTPDPDVKRVIFIATPQRGSFVAGSWIGSLAGRLVRMPITVAGTLAETMKGNPDVLRIAPQVARLGSVWSMTPGNPAVQALASIPVTPAVDAHSIIAVAGDGPVQAGNDGVVTYKSAHIAEAKSELVVRSGHSVQANPHAINEVHRILLLHLQENCPRGCVPAPGIDAWPGGPPA